VHYAQAAVEHEHLDPRLREAIGVRFTRLLTQRRRELSALRDAVDAGEVLQDGWSTLHAIRAAAQPLFAECLTVVEGGLVRGIGLDRGLCATADALLGELSRLSEVPWDRFTVLAEGESINDVADIIRLRFPEVGVWSVPVAAHELGHHVGRTLAGEGDLMSSTLFTRAGRAGPRVEAHTHEQFADCYATYALGPAYPCACILQRFDPKTAFDATDEHPDAARRVALCLFVLTRMDDDDLRPFADVIETLASAWQPMVEAATGRTPSVEVDGDAVQAEQYWDVLEHAVPAARYRGWLRAKELTYRLLDEHARGGVPSADADNLRDAINAAWAARLSGPRGLALALEQWSEQCCLRLADTE
jgi:hypothetical protein